MGGIDPSKGGPPTACTRLPTARFIKNTVPAKMPMIGDSLAGPAAGEAEALDLHGGIDAEIQISRTD